MTELLQTGAKQLIHQAVEAELGEFLSQFAGQCTDAGQANVFRNGYQPERAIQTGMGPVTVRIPKVLSRTGEPVTFRSALVPPYIRNAKSLEKLGLGENGSGNEGGFDSLSLIRDSLNQLGLHFARSDLLP